MLRGRAARRGYDDVNLHALREPLRAGPGAVTAPVYAYNHAAKVVAGETCPTGSSSITGMAFYPETGGTFPASYRGGLFFADHTRNCIWFMPKGANGQPDPATAWPSSPARPTRSTSRSGPDGDLFYVDFDGGTIRRITRPVANQPPTAAIAATPTSGAAPLTVRSTARPRAIRRAAP